MSKSKIMVMAVAVLVLFGTVSVAKAENVYSNIFGHDVRTNTEVKASTSIRVFPAGGHDATRSDDNKKGEKESMDKMDKENDHERFTFNASTTVNANNMESVKARADREIDRRISALTKLSTRISAMVKISTSTKDSLNLSIKTEISNLTTLKAKIDADTDPAVLRADIASITSGFRIYMLIMPKVSILAAADRINVIAGMMTSVGAKLDARISAANAGGHDTSLLKSFLEDYNNKLEDAKIQAQAAINLVINLSPDNKDQSKMQANEQAMKDARAKIEAGKKDLKAAEKDAKDIIKGLRTFGDVKASDQ